jgi:hypothetical protein
MLNNFGADDFGIPPINMDDLPFLNVPDDIDNVEIKLEEPFVNETLFDGLQGEPENMGDRPNKKQRNKQVQQIRKELLKYDKRI